MGIQGLGLGCLGDISFSPKKKKFSTTDLHFRKIQESFRLNSDLYTFTPLLNKQYSDLYFRKIRINSGKICMVHLISERFSSDLE